MKGKPLEEEDSLFDPDEEDKNMEYEKMDSLADIDDMPAHFSDDERKDKAHRQELRNEQKEYINSLREGNLSLIILVIAFILDMRDFRTRYEEAAKDREKFEKILNEETDEVMKEFSKDEDVARGWREYQERAKGNKNVLELHQKLLESHFEELKEEREKSKILKEKQTRLKDLHKRNNKF